MILLKFPYDIVRHRMDHACQCISGCLVAVWEAIHAPHARRHDADESGRPEHRALLRGDGTVGGTTTYSRHGRY